MAEFERGRSLAETPTWAFATVVSVMVAFGFFFRASLKQFGKVRGKTLNLRSLPFRPIDACIPAEMKSCAWL